MQHSQRPSRFEIGDLNRRQFLGAGLASAIAVGSSSAALAGPSLLPQPWKMKLSTSSLHYRSLPIKEACRRIGLLGFKGIDIWAHFEWAGPTCEHLEGALEKIGPKPFEELLGKHGLSLFSASCYGAPFRRFAPKLGQMGGCVVVRGSQGRKVESGKSLSPSDLTRQMKQFLASLQPDLELAEQYNCTLAIENHSGESLLNQIDSFKAFTDLNQHKRLGIALAPYHIQLNQESVEEAIRIAGGQLKFFYAWQHAEGTDQLPGIGKTDMRPWLKALAAIKYQGYVNPFMHHEPEPDEMDVALARSREYLLEIYRQLSA